MNGASGAEAGEESGTDAGEDYPPVDPYPEGGAEGEGDDPSLPSDEYRYDEHEELGYHDNYPHGDDPYPHDDEEPPMDDEGDESRPWEEGDSGQTWEEDDPADAGAGTDDLPVDSEAEALRTKHREANDAVSEVERQIADLEKKLSSDYGPNQRFESLSRSCFESALGGEWNYEICPFKNAAQKGKTGGSTSIGNWEGFADDYMTLKFSNGTPCWNGPSRSLTVSLVCGGENKVLAVDEPEVCKYTMRFQTPAGCTAEQEAAAQADLDALSAAVHDEL